MEVAAHPDHGCRIERGVPRPVLPKEMALAAEEGEGTLSHRLVLHVEALGITPLVEAEELIPDQKLRADFAGRGYHVFERMRALEETADVLDDWR